VIPAKAACVGAGVLKSQISNFKCRWAEPARGAVVDEGLPTEATEVGFLADLYYHNGIVEQIYSTVLNQLHRY
jgi:hypothetical protein